MLCGQVLGDLLLVFVNPCCPNSPADGEWLMILSKGKEMRSLLLGPLFAAIATLAVAAPMPKEQLSTPTADARHYVISSTAGKHGDVWSWTRPDGRVAYRMSMSLRGWVTEEDERVRVATAARRTAMPS